MHQKCKKIEIIKACLIFCLLIHIFLCSCLRGARGLNIYEAEQGVIFVDCDIKMGLMNLL